MNCLFEQKNKHNNSAFTIVELLVIIVIIGILSAITFISYSGISNKAATASLQSDLSSNAKLLKMYYIENGQYPSSLNSYNCPVPTDTRYCLRASTDTELSYSSNDINSFNLYATKLNITYLITENTQPTLSTNIIGSVEVLAVGGGGSGAASATGGTGGAGGSIIHNNTQSITKTTNVIIGSGGATVSSDSNGNIGEDTYFGSLKAPGGIGGVVGSSTASATNGTQSDISGTNTFYGGSGGSSASDYYKTAGGTGGGGGGVPSSAYGDGSRNLVSNGYAGLLYRSTGLLPYTTTYVVNAGNFFGTMGDISSRVSGPTTQHLPKNNSGAILSSATSTSNTYTFNPVILANRQVEIEMHGGNLTTGIAITGINLNFNGTIKSLSQAVTDGYIEPMVVMNSGVSTGSYYWANIFNIYTNTSTGNGNYPSGGVLITLKGYNLTGFTLNLNKGFHSTDGIMVTSWDRLGGISMSPIPSINGTNGLGGGGGANTASNSGSGGSGVVIVKYPTGSLNATGGTITTSGGNTIHTFTSNGAFTVN